MKKYLYQLLITSIIFWIISPIVELFIEGSQPNKETYLNSDLIITSFIFGLVFIFVYNLILKRI